MFEFANIWVLWLLPLPFVVFWLISPLRIKSEVVLVPFLDRAASATGEKLKKGAWINKKSAFQWIFLILSWVCLLLALAKPQLVGESTMKIKTERSFLVAADISFSMAVKDWVVNGERLSRWEAVKDVLGDFIAKRQGDRMALVFFGTNAYLQTPFTTDLEVVEWFLEETDVGMAGQMTSVGKAIGFGIKMFKEDTLKQKVMLILTDGQDGGKGISPLDAAYLAKNDSITVYTLGIGDPLAPGSDLDEVTLQNIAKITGGKYFRAIDQEAMKEVYKTLEMLEPMEFEEEEFKPVTALYYYPLVAAIILGFALFFFRRFKLLVKSG